jgi:hypothetical protein
VKICVICVKVFPGLRFLRVLRATRFRILALSGVTAYAENVVKQPFINVEKEPKSLHELFMQAGLQAGIDRSAEISRRMKSGEVRFPKGVFRFKTVEEFSEWKENILAGNQPKKDERAFSK